MIHEAVRDSACEVNLHDVVMDDIERYEQSKIRRSTYLEIVLSSLLILLSIASIGFIYWAFGKYAPLFQAYNLDAGLIGTLFISMFLIFIAIVSFLTVKLIYFLRHDEKKLPL